MAVIIDIAGTEVVGAAAASSPQTYTGLTTGASLSNGCVTFIVIYDNLAVTGTSATWDGVPCTLIASQNSTGGTFGRVELWGLSPIGTHTGNKTFSVTFSGGTAQVLIQGLSWTGADQTGATTTFNHSVAATNNTNAPTGNVTSQTGDAVFAGFVCASQTFNSVSGTQLFNDPTPNNYIAAGNRDVGAATVTMSASLSGISIWAMAGANIKQASATAPTGGGAIYDAGTTFNYTVTSRYIAQPVFFTAPAPTGWNGPLWQDPARSKIAPLLAIALMASGLFAPPPQITTAATVATTAAADITGPTFTKTFIYQAITQPVVFTTAVPTGWNNPLEQPVRDWRRSPIYSAPFLALGVPPSPAQVWFPPNVTPDIVPTRAKPVVDFIPWTFLEPAPQVFFPYDRWSEPVRLKPRAPDFQFLAQNPVQTFLPGVQFDNQGAPVTGNSATSFSDNSLTIANNANCALVVTLNNGAVAGSPSLTWNGVPLVQLAAIQENDLTGESRIFGLLNPAVGNHTLAGSWSNAVPFFANSLSFYNVDQSSYANAFPKVTTTNGATAPISVSVAGTTGDMFAGCASSDQVVLTPTSQIPVFAGQTPSGFGAAVSRALGQSIALFTYHESSSSTWSAAAIDIKPPSEIGWFAAWPDFAPRARSPLNFNPLAFGTFVTPSFIPTYTQWTQWPDFALRAKAAVNYQSWAFLEPAPQVFFPYAPWDDFARRKPPPLDTQPLAWSTFTPLQVTTYFTSAWPDFATKKPPPLNYNPLTFVANPQQVFFPYEPWDDFSRRKPQPLDTQPLAWSTFTPAAVVTFATTASADIAGPTFTKTFIYQAIAQPVAVTPAAAAIVATFNSEVIFPWTLIYQALTYPVNFTAAPVINTWAQWPDFALRAKRAADFTPWTFIPPPQQVFFPHSPWDDFARRKQPPLDTQPLAWNSLQIAATVPTMAWTNWPDFAPRARPATDAPSSVFLALVPTATTIADWADFAPRKTQPLDTQPLAWSPTQFAAATPTMAWVNWPDIVPTRPKRVVDFISWTFLAPTLPTVWTQWTIWPDQVPARKKPAADFISWTFIPPPAQVFFPYAPWDDFARRKSPPLDTQPLAEPINFTVEVTLVSKWFEALSVPPGPKRGLGAHLQSSYTNDTIAAAIALFARIRWYAPLSEPVRRKGIRPEFQKFTERDLFIANFYLASLNATEQGDFLTAVLSQFNTPISAYVDIVQNDPRQRGNLGVIENVAQSSIIASIAEPQTVPATGQPVSTVAGARVAIIVT